MESKNSLLKIHSKIQSLLFCAFVNKIVFGKSEDDKFVNNKYFEININEISEVFCGLFYIVKAFSTKSDASGLLSKKSESLFYKWEVKHQNKDAIIELLIYEANERKYQLSISILEFNDLVFLLGHLILPSLNLTGYTQRAFELISEMDLDQINKLKQEKQMKRFLDDFIKNIGDVSQFEANCIKILTQYHLDVIVAVHCIKSLYNNDLNITNSNINLMLSCK